MSQLKNLITNLKKANERLKEASKAEPTQLNKDATIQRFEFTFELAWKTMQEKAREEGIRCNSPKDCIREAARLGLIGDVGKVEEWFEYLNKRNLITHTYNEELANKIYQKVKEFPKEVDVLLEKIGD